MMPTGEWFPHSNDSSGHVLSYARGGLNMLVYYVSFTVKVTEGVTTVQQ